MVRKGTYILLLSLGNPVTIEIGRIGVHHFDSGFYAYIGSGMNSIDARLARHFGFTDKKIHWHVDYLLTKGKAFSAFSHDTETRNECLIAKAFGRKYTIPIKGFGASDCNCSGHLFYLGEKLPPEFHLSKLLIGRYVFIKWEPIRRIDPTGR